MAQSSPCPRRDGSLVANEFLAIVDDRSRQMVVLLKSGFTKATEIA